MPRCSKAPQLTERKLSVLKKPLPKPPNQLAQACAFGSNSKAPSPGRRNSFEFKYKANQDKDRTYDASRQLSDECWE